MARLVLLSEGLTGRAYDLKGAKTTIGRVADNDFQIPEGSVSSHHCELHLQGKDVLVKDLGSTNGTFINGERVEEATLKQGQILRLGMIEMRLESGEAPSPIPSGSTTTTTKKTLDQTRVIPQGVKLDELEGVRGPLNFETRGFEKKTNRATIVFVIICVAVGLILAAALFYLVMR